MKPSEILREAAQHIEQGRSRYGCFAIMSAGQCENHLSEAVALEHYKLFKPTTEERQRYGYRHATAAFGWFGENTDVHEKTNPGSHQPDANDIRILALCFAAAIAESRGD